MTDQILLIEDDFALGDELFDSLDDEGYDVTWIKDGTEAYREPIEGYDLVLLDLMLPGKHGFDVLKKYRENSDVPVISLTARRETRDKLRGFELGSDDFMTKPFRWPSKRGSSLTGPSHQSASSSIATRPWSSKR